MGNMDWLSIGCALGFVSYPVVMSLRVIIANAMKSKRENE